MLARGMAAFSHHFQPAFRRTMLARGEFLTADRQSAVGARPDTDVIAIAPIGKVVPRFRAGTRIVRYLVAIHAGVAQHRCSQLVQLRLHLFLGQHEIAARIGLLEHGAGFDGQLIERDVIGGESERPGQLSPPLFDVLAGPCVNEVEGEAVEGFGSET